MAAKDFQLVGWYHSHPVSEPKPSQSDILSQKKYQDTVPCVGIIVSKYDDPVPNSQPFSTADPYLALIVSDDLTTPYQHFVSGPNHGGKLKKMASQLEVFWVLMLQQNGLQV